MAELTPRQQEIFDFIRRGIEKGNVPPTRAEICTAFGFSSLNAAEQHLRALAAKGVIEMVAGASRGIRLTPMAVAESLGLPLIGRVAAGSPILAVENVERRVEVDPAIFKPRADYLLKVRGQSMRDAGILDGDLIAVARSKEVKNGEIVVARLGEEVTVKRLETLPSRRGANANIRLLPENPDFQPIEVDGKRDDFSIEGVMVGLLRWS
jgi:repressor LexA